MESKSFIDKITENKFTVDVVKEILYYCKNKLDPDNVDVKFDISKGKMISEDINTTISFNIDKSMPNLYLLKKGMFEKEYNDEEEEVLVDKVKEIATYIQDNHVDEVREILLTSVLPGADRVVFPIKEINILGVEVFDVEDMEMSQTHTLKVHKLVRKDQMGVSPSGISPILLQEHNDTGEDVNDIIKRYKSKNDPRFTSVTHADWTRYLFDFYLVLWADYSPNNREAIENAIKGSN